MDLIPMPSALLSCFLLAQETRQKQVRDRSSGTLGTIKCPPEKGHNIKSNHDRIQQSQRQSSAAQNAARHGGLYHAHR